MTLIGMKRLALGLLVAMGVVFVISTQLQAAYPALAWLRAFSEAAAVGALADWFAVTALFRHPLGLPIPHTAIIPRNKDEIGATLGAFVEHNFLTPENVMQRMARADLARMAAEWLREPVNANACAQRLNAVLSVLVEQLDDVDVRRVLGEFVKRESQRLDFSAIIGNLLNMLVGQGRLQALLSRGLNLADEWLSANRALVQAKVSEGSRYTPKFVDAYISNRFIDGVLALIHEIASDPKHEMRLKFDQSVHDFILRLKTHATYQERVREIAQAGIDQLSQGDHYTRLWADIKARIAQDLASQEPIVQRHVAGALAVLANCVLADRAMLDKLNTWLAQAMEVTMLRHRHQVSRLITEVVKMWDARQISETIEAEIGKDLQFIRINGTVVGGIVGLVLHGAHVLMGA